MARITVEDCIDKFPSRFELVLVASNRARKLHAGESPTVEIDNDKNTVIALREIADETIGSEQLKNELISEYQTTTFSEDEDIDELENNIDETQSQTESQTEISYDSSNQSDQIMDNENQVSNAESSEVLAENSYNHSDENKI